MSDKPKVLMFSNHMLPWDKLCYAERVVTSDGQEQVRCHLVSYGYFDAPVAFDEFLQQVIAMLEASSA